MKVLNKLCVAIFAISSTSIGIAQQISSSSDTALKKKQKTLQELYGGVVVNQTITVAGQDFYQYFVASWRDRELSERYAISIHERPSARWGSQVWIEYAQKRVFQASLPTSRANIKELSDQAVEMAYQKVIDVEVERAMFHDADVGQDEI